MIEGEVEPNDHYSIVGVNDAFTEVFGYDDAEILDRDIADTLVPEDERAEHEQFRERVAAGESFTAEVERTTADGNRTFLLDVVSYGTDSTPADGWFTTYTDITERNEREEELELYETMLETVPDGVYALDEDLRYITVNQELSDLTGHSKEKLIGSHLSLVNTEEAIEATERNRDQLLDEASDADDVKVVEHAYLTADGEEVPCEVRFRPLPPAEDGSFRGTAGVVRDISERKEYEEELEAYREYTDRLLDAIDDLFFVHDENGDLQRWNESLAEATCYDDEAIESMSGVYFVPEDHRERTEAAIREVFETGHARLEAPLLTKDGTTIPYEYVADCVEGPDGEPRLVGIGRDISERKERERELERQNERLEEFASVVSHDLRNPLNIAEGNVELAREACDSAHLDDVAAAFDRMDALIEDILTVAREGEAVEDVEAVDLAAVVGTCWETVETADATLVVDTERTIHADRSRLRQLLENLVRNAVEHGRTDVTVTVGDLDDERGFYVADDGPGIPADERERMFEQGYSTSAEGTGFGLAIVAEIAEAHGWRIDVTESESGGARFEITGVETAT